MCFWFSVIQIFFEAIIKFDLSDIDSNYESAVSLHDDITWIAKSLTRTRNANNNGRAVALAFVNFHDFFIKVLKVLITGAPIEADDSLNIAPVIHRFRRITAQQFWCGSCTEKFCGERQKSADDHYGKKSRSKMSKLATTLFYSEV